MRKKKPWPTKKAMEQVYEEKLWGNNGSTFYSGDGSHYPDLVKPYTKAITAFLQSFASPITICDLGCGDFNVGKELVPFTKKYIGVDIVQGLIDYNRHTFQFPNLEFQCLDIANDPIPSADVVILRQVLQHLSNTEAQNVVSKLTKYRYMLLTEHLPEGEFVPNKDIISGQGIRLKKQSGLDVLAAPFQMKVKKTKTLLSQKAEGYDGVIVTWLFRMF